MGDALLLEVMSVAGVPAQRRLELDGFIEVAAATRGK